MFKKVLVPIDVSHAERNGELIERAKDLVDKSDGVISILNVIEDVPGYVAAELPAGIHERVLERARNELEKLAAKHELPHSTEIHIAHGHPSKQILEASEKAEADVIVIASHQPGLADYFLGSVAGKVVRHAHCCVMVLR